MLIESYVIYILRGPLNLLEIFSLFNASFCQLVEVTADLAEENKTASQATEMLETESAERMRLEKELKDIQVGEQSGNSGTIRESNQASGVRKARYA